LATLSTLCGGFVSTGLAPALVSATLALGLVKTRQAFLAHHIAEA
jgi:hypothetical protein